MDHDESEAIHRNELAAAVAKTPKVKRPLTPDARLAAVRKIIAERQCARVEGVLLDIQSAHAYVTVADGLSAENRARFIAMPLARAVRMAWKLVK